ncbi:hypothetical protein [Amycolatopsis japonica]
MSCPALLEVPVETGEFVLSAPQTRTLPPCMSGEEGLQCGLGGSECPTDPAKVALCPSC